MVLIGRAEAITDILTLTEAAATGRSQFGLVQGEAGIGKTALLRAVTDRLATRGIRAIYGRGDDLERSRPFRLVLQLAQEIDSGNHLADPAMRAVLLAGIRATGDSHDGGTESGEHVLSNAFVEVVESMAIEAPLVLLVDDLQWADGESAAVLHRIRKELADLPVVVVGAARLEPIPAGIAAAFAEAKGIRLGPLPTEDLEELAGVTVGAAPGPMLVRELNRSGGNPFFALELLRTLRANDRLVFGDGRVDLSELALPNELRSSLLQRIAELDPKVVDLLSVASVLGSTFTTKELDRLAERRGTGRLLAGAVRIGLLDRDGEEGFAFRHDLVRAAIYDAVGPARLAELHRRAATVLASLGAPSPRLASHLLRSADDETDEERLDLLEHTARDLQRSSAAGSVELAERCVRLVEPGSPRHIRVLAGMVEPLLYLGRLEDAERVTRRVLDLGTTELDLDRRRDLRFILYQAVSRQDDIARGIADIEVFLQDPDLRPGDAAFLRICRAQGVLQQGRTEGAREDAEFVLAVGEELGDSRLCVGANLVLGFLASAAGRNAEASDYGRRAAELQGTDGAWYLADLYHGLVQMNADELTDALGTLNRGRNWARSRGDLSSQASYDWVIGGRHYSAGEWDDCLTEMEVGFNRVPPASRRPHMVLVGRAFAARVHLHRGDYDAARAEIERGDADLAAGSLVGGDAFLWAKALLLEHDGELEAGLSLLDLGFQLTAKVRYLVTWRAILPDIVRLARAVGNDAVVTQVVAAAEQGALASGGQPSARACAFLCRGLAEDDVDLLVRAAAACRRTPRVTDLARCSAAAGMAMAQAGRVEEATQLLKEASGIYEERRAFADLAPIEEVLRTLDASRVPSRKRPSQGWASLTRSELRVADLVAAGRTTPEIASALFVSPSTIATHIKHIFSKLGVNSRAAVAAAAVRHQHDDSE